MKKIIAGTGFEITGVLMLMFSFLITSMNIENTNEWDTRLGRFWQTVFDFDLFPMMIAGIVLLVTGVAFSLWGVFQKTDQ